MAKKKTQIKKPSIAAILGMILLGLVLVGVVANVIKSNPKEETPIEDEYLTASVYVGGYKQLAVEFEYLEGMTWEEIINLNKDLKDFTGEYSFSVNSDGHVEITGEGLTPGGKTSSLLGFDGSGGEGVTAILATEEFNPEIAYSQYIE